MIKKDKKGLFNMPIDYQQGKIYKIYNDDIPDKVYYGSTCSTLVKRLHQHKNGFGKVKNKCTSSVLFPGAKIVLVEKYPCNDKDELTKRERYYIENNECVNKCITGRTPKEWHQDNKRSKEDIKKKNKEYYIKNKTKLISKVTKQRENNIDKRLKYEKEYRIKNKKEIKKKNKEYRIKNKKEITKKRKEQIGCRVCKCMVNKEHFERHTKTKKHINKLN